jgi:hypothetical protein
MSLIITLRVLGQLHTRQALVELFAEGEVHQITE